MKFRHKNPLYLDILIIILALVQIGMIFINICKFAGWFDMYSLMTTLEICQMIMSILILIVCGFMMFMQYKFIDKKIKIQFGPFDLTGGKFEIERVRAAIKRSIDNGLYLSIYTDDVEPTIIKINISQTRYDEFIEDLKKQNPDINVVVD